MSNKCLEPVTGATIDPTGLCIIRGDAGGLTVNYLGYRLLLSPAETRMVVRLCEASTGVCTMAELREAAGNGRPASAGTVTVLVGRINRKAETIGGRMLICGRSHHGYRLAEDA